MGNALLSAGTFGLNNIFGDWAASRAAQRNYKYGEMAASNADARTRALYNDFYSPKALTKQYQAAGLSPSMMYGGTPGQGGMSGAQGTGAAGTPQAYAPLSLLDAAQAAALNAQTEKTKAETKKVEAETTGTELQNAWQEFTNKEKSIEFKLSTSYLTTSNGEKTSLFELAEYANTYEDFLKKVKECAVNSNDLFIADSINTEQGQKVLRQIFTSASRLERDIKVLSEEGVNADFQIAIINALNKKGFAEQNAETALKELEAAGESADLTKEQKASFNHIIEKLRKMNSTTADIAIIASMIVGQYMQHHSIIPGKK